VIEQMFALYREKYFDFNVRHFHEKLEQEHEIRLSYTWVKKALQGAGLVRAERQCEVHRRRRGTLAGCAVTVCEPLDQSWSIRYGPHVVGRYNAQGWPCLSERKLDRLPLR